MGADICCIAMQENGHAYDPDGVVDHGQFPANILGLLPLATIHPGTLWGHVRYNESGEHDLSRFRAVSSWTHVAAVIATTFVVIIISTTTNERQVVDEPPRRLPNCTPQISSTQLPLNECRTLQYCVVRYIRVAVVNDHSLCHPRNHRGHQN